MCCLRFNYTEYKNDADLWVFTTRNTVAYQITKENVLKGRETNSHVNYKKRSVIRVPIYARCFDYVVRIFWKQKIQVKVWGLQMLNFYVFADVAAWCHTLPGRGTSNAWLGAWNDWGKSSEYLALLQCHRMQPRPFEDSLEIIRWQSLCVREA